MFAPHARFPPGGHQFTAVSIAALCALVVLHHGVASGGDYAVTLLPPGSISSPDNDDVNHVEDISDSGQVLYHNDVVEPGVHMEAYSINESGQIVGLYIGRNFFGGFLKSGNDPPVLIEAPAPGFGSTIPTAINNLGQIVGFVRVLPAVPERYLGFLRETDGAFRYLGFPGADSTFPLDINERSVIVGSYRVAGREQAFMLEGTEFKPLTTPGPECDASGINNDSTIIGNCYGPEFVFRSEYAYVKHGTADSAQVDILRLGTRETSVSGINNQGQIVGTFENEGGLPQDYLAHRLVRLSTSTDRARVGDHVSLGIAVHPAADRGDVDVYVGAILPDGQTVVILGTNGMVAAVAQLAHPGAVSPTFVAQAGTITNTPSFFTGEITGAFPLGIYQVFVAMLRHEGLGDGRLDQEDILALDVKAVEVVPE